MSSPYRRSITIPNTGDRFDSYDVHVERFVPIILKYIRTHYGEPDQAWLAAVEKAHNEAMNADPLRPDHATKPASYATFDFFKNAVFRPSMKGIGNRGWKKKRDPDEPEDTTTRGHAFVQAKRMMQWYGIDQVEIVGTGDPTQFHRDHYTRWPYYAGALALVVERARSIPHEVHVVPERAEAGRDEDLQHHPLVYAVPGPRREGGEGSDAAHREGPADGEELAGAAHPARRSPGGRKRRWSSAGSRTSGSSSSSGAGAARQRKP